MTQWGAERGSAYLSERFKREEHRSFDIPIYVNKEKCLVVCEFHFCIHIQVHSLSLYNRVHFSCYILSIKH